MGQGCCEDWCCDVCCVERLMIEVFDDAIPREAHIDIVRMMLETRDQFFWFYSPSVTPNEYDRPHNDEVMELEDYQFYHPFFAGPKVLSPYLNILTPIVNRLGVYSLIKVKANLNPHTSQPITHGFHTDIPLDVMSTNTFTAIYYLNTCNGKTIFEDGRSVDCVANRLVVFPSSMRHSGITTTDSKYKAIINFNYIGSRQ